MASTELIPELNIRPISISTSQQLYSYPLIKCLKIIGGLASFFMKIKDSHMPD